MSSNQAAAKQPQDLSPEEEAALDGTAPPPADRPPAQPAPDEDGDDGPVGGTIREQMEDLAGASGVPAWASVPEGLVFPPGRQVGFMLFKAEWTDTPQKGDRQCIVWNLTARDEKWALKRARGDDTRAMDELAKATVRAVDGRAADWSGNPKARQDGSSVEEWWNEIGSKCRAMVKNYYLRTHSMTDQEKIDFFANCIAVTSSRG